MPTDMTQLPDDADAQNFHVNQIVQAWQGLVNHGVPMRQNEVRDDQLFALDVRNRGVGGLHLRVQHSSNPVDLLTVTDAGITVSPDGGLTPAGDFFIHPLFVVMWHSSADPPLGWFTCDGLNGTPDLRDSFIVGAGLSFARGEQGGSFSADITHNHASAAHAHSHHHQTGSHAHSHAHTSASHAHGHSHAAGTLALTTPAHTHGSGTYSVDSHTHGITTATGQTLGDGSFSSSDKTGTVSNFDNNDTGHTHGLNHAHGGSTQGAGSSLSGSSGDGSGTFSGAISNATGTDTTFTTPGLVGIDSTSTTTPDTTDDATFTTPNPTGSGGGSISILPFYYGSLFIMRGP